MLTGRQTAENRQENINAGQVVSLRTDSTTKKR